MAVVVLFNPIRSFFFRPKLDKYIFTRPVHSCNTEGTLWNTSESLCLECFSSLVFLKNVCIFFDKVEPDLQYCTDTMEAQQFKEESVFKAFQDAIIPVIEGTVKFTKKIPKFSSLDMLDRIVLLKQNCYSVILILVSQLCYSIYTSNKLACGMHYNFVINIVVVILSLRSQSVEKKWQPKVSIISLMWNRVLYCINRTRSANSCVRRLRYVQESYDFTEHSFTYQYCRVACGKSSKVTESFGL